jgi:acyl-CoA reductase-like NAD-dependent aldehyde dehydrogenase
MEQQLYVSTCSTDRSRSNGGSAPLATLSAVPDSIRLINPTDESLLRELPLATCEEADVAIARARQAAPAWRAVAPADRARLMRRFADVIADHADELGRLETANMGMPIGSSTWCANAAADVIHYFAGAIDKHTGSTIPVTGGVDVTFHEPLGVVGLITPWNFPVLMASWKIGPARRRQHRGDEAGGDHAAHHDASRRTGAGSRFRGCLERHRRYRREVGWRLVEHRDVRKVAFTGSTSRR